MSAENTYKDSHSNKAFDKHSIQVSIDKLNNKFRINDSEEGSQLSEEWWDNLSEEWQNVFLFNVAFYADKSKRLRWDSIKSMYDNYYDEYRCEYVKVEEYDIYELLDDIYNLKFLRITCFDTDDNLYFDRIKLDSLEPLGALHKLEFLVLWDNAEDLTPLSGLVRLKSLELWMNKQSLKPLSELINLIHLDLFENEVSLDGLSGIRYLEILELWGNTQDLNPISELKNLRSLDLGNNTQDLSPIVNLTALEYLNLNGNKADINCISGLIEVIKDRGGRVVLDGSS